MVVSVSRKIINEPRPYEKYGVPPVLDKDTSGKSFPSRHVFSVFVIAVTGVTSSPSGSKLTSADLLPALS